VFDQSGSFAASSGADGVVVCKSMGFKPLGHFRLQGLQQIQWLTNTNTNTVHSLS
jgi:hypothetical protein